MLIAVDGACKRNGQPTCSSSGVAWIQTEEGDYLYKSCFETCSTNQRGEINGLLEALKYAALYSKADEDIIIITDSEYLHNTVALDWVGKWARNNWVGGTGPVKNPDMWNEVYRLLRYINKNQERVFMQWTKGHLMAYTPGNINQAMSVDPTGVELFTRITTIANREVERSRIIKEFMNERREHDKATIPGDIALEWVIANTVADCIASFVVKIMDSI